MPGGVGPVTNAVLLEHLIRAARWQQTGHPIMAGHARKRRAASAPRARRADMKSSLEIAREARLRPIVEIAASWASPTTSSTCTARTRPRSSPSRTSAAPTSPTARDRGHRDHADAAGEGKTTTTVGLAQGLNRIGVETAAAIRQPVLGPVFGLKGGAAGGGFSQVLPMEEINIHFTGDLHAVAAAHNLGAAFLDNHLFRGNDAGYRSTAIRWPRVIDVNDRALRRVEIGLGEKSDVRESECHITAASEVMAILALANDLQDLRRRLGR